MMTSTTATSDNWYIFNDSTTNDHYYYVNPNVIFNEEYKDGWYTVTVKEVVPQLDDELTKLFEEKL